MITRNSIHLANNVTILSQLPDNSIDLVYIDPPFGTGNFQQINSTVYDIVTGYSDLLVDDEYFRTLQLRLVQIHRILKKTGSLFLHMDFRNVHLARLICDSVFGHAPINEIIWAYDYGGRGRDRWPKKHDNILWYGKSLTDWTFNYDEIERIPYMAPGLVGPEKAAIGKLPTDVWWMTIVPTNGSERTGYPNQKPEKLLERIISASSKPGDIVADFYCGSGTTGVVAKRLGRDYLLVDNNTSAIEVTRKRLGTHE